MKIVSVKNWNCQKVKEWIKNKGFLQYAEIFCDIYKIDGQVLLFLIEKDLK